jgi:glycosyltransferase involved in cell wall biosynthesis
VKFFQNSENKGVGFTKKRCVEEASGEICGFVDPDDALTENAIEISVKAYNENYIATYSQFYLCDENLNIQKILKEQKIKNKIHYFLIPI